MQKNISLVVIIVFLSSFFLANVEAQKIRGGSGSGGTQIKVGELFPGFNPDSPNDPHLNRNAEAPDLSRRSNFKVPDIKAVNGVLEKTPVGFITNLTLPPASFTNSTNGVLTRVSFILVLEQIPDFQIPTEELANFVRSFTLYYYNGITTVPLMTTNLRYGRIPQDSRLTITKMRYPNTTEPDVDEPGFVPPSGDAFNYFLYRVDFKFSEALIVPQSRVVGFGLTAQEVQGNGKVKLTANHNFESLVQEDLFIVYFTSSGPEFLRTTDSPICVDNSCTGQTWPDTRVAHELEVFKFN